MLKTSALRHYPIIEKYKQKSSNFTPSYQLQLQIARNKRQQWTAAKSAQAQALLHTSQVLDLCLSSAIPSAIEFNRLF